MTTMLPIAVAVDLFPPFEATWGAGEQSRFNRSHQQNILAAGPGNLDVGLENQGTAATGTIRIRAVAVVQACGSRLAYHPWNEVGVAERS